MKFKPARPRPPHSRSAEDRPALGGLPAKDEIVKFLADQPAKVGKREIARAFGIKGDARIALKRLLAEMTAEGLIGRERGKGLTPAGVLPAVAVLEVTAAPVDGDITARPVPWTGEGPPPLIEVVPGSRGAGPAPGLGDRILARLDRIEDHDGQFRYEARIIRTLSRDAERFIAVVRREHNGDYRLVPTDRRAKSDYRIAAVDLNGAADGELVAAEALPGRAIGLPKARVRECLGDMSAPRAISLIAIHAHGIPTVFAEEALAEARAARPVPLGSREDLRALPLITIDPIDARDHDDAIFAEVDPDPANPGGYHVVVAIADVAHYVRPGSALDRAARERGNSAYFPDRVVPMLPEELSSDLCSLLEGEDRACLAVHLWLDAEGQKLRHRFCRGLMRVAAGLAYEAAQDAIDGRVTEATAPLVEPVLKPLWAAWRAAMIARERREPLDIEMPERVIRLSPEGKVASIEPRLRLDAHRVVEEFMILANVAAAEALEARNMACMYRVHDQPSPEKLAALREFLASLEIKLAKGQVLKPRHFNGILAKARGTVQERAINEIVLRSQAQAIYTSENIGHFGLSLRRYAHFTSPIRRYADVLVHRGLISAYDLGDDGLSPADRAQFEETAEHISQTERRAMAAERESGERYLAAYMADHVDARFTARITGATRFGLFVTIEENGVTGLVPISSLGHEFFYHDEASHALIGEKSRARYALGDQIKVILREATPITGGLVFTLASDSRRGGPDQGEAPRRGGRPFKPGLPKPRRVKGRR